MTGHPTIYRLTVAGTGLALRGDGALGTVLQSDRYRPFLAAGAGEVAARVEVTTAEVNREEGYRSSGPQTELEGWSLSYRIYGGEGWLDARRGEGWLRMSAEEHLAHGALGNYLRVAYALLLIRQGGLLFHSAGMIREGQGVLFYGHSGSGKTTVSRLSQAKATLLSDDLVALRPQDGEWRIHGTPFWGDLDGLPKTRSSAPLRALFALVKDREVGLERLPQSVATADVVSSVPVTSQEPAISGRLVDLVADLVARVPCYRLRFRPDDSFWPAVDGALA